MTRQTADERDDFDDDFDEDSESEESTITCPHCGGEVYADSPRCPSCENYLSQEDAPTSPINKPWWVLLGAGLGLLAFLRWLFV